MKMPTYLTLALAAFLVGCNQGAPAPEKTVQQLMANEVQPTAEVYWNSVQFISDETGDHDIRPETDEDWQRTKAGATRLAELGELLQTPAYADGRGEDWVEISRSLVEVSRLAEQAADSRDPDKVFEVGGTIYNVCTACHQIYPATTEPEAEEAVRPGDEEYDAPGEG